MTTYQTEAHPIILSIPLERDSVVFASVVRIFPDPAPPKSVSSFIEDGIFEYTYTSLLISICTLPTLGPIIIVIIVICTAH